MLVLWGTSAVRLTRIMQQAAPYLKVAEQLSKLYRHRHRLHCVHDLYCHPADRKSRRARKTRHRSSPSPARDISDKFHQRSTLSVDDILTLFGPSSIFLNSFRMLSPNPLPPIPASDAAASQTSPVLLLRLRAGLPLLFFRLPIRTSSRGGLRGPVSSSSNILISRLFSRTNFSLFLIASLGGTGGGGELSDAARLSPCPGKSAESVAARSMGRRTGDICCACN